MLVALAVCAILSLRLVAQEKASGSGLILPKQAAPPKLKLYLSFREPSGSGVLIPGETGELTVVVANAGETRAKGVKVELAVNSSSRFYGVTFTRDFPLGDINPSDQKNIAVSFVAGKTLKDENARIGVIATETVTQMGFSAGIVIVTTSGLQTQPLTADRSRLTDTLSKSIPRNQAPDELFPAIRQLREKLATNPNDNLTRLELTQLLFDSKMYSDAIVEGQKALGKFPDKANLAYQLGESERQLNNYSEALKHLERGYNLLITPYPELASSYAHVLLHFGKVQEATPVLRLATAGDPAFISNCLSAGNEKYKADEMEDAAVEYQAVLILDRTRLTPDQLLFVQFNSDFKNAVQSKDPTEVTSGFIEYVKKKLGSNLDYDELGATFQCMITSKRLDQARDLFNEIIVLTGETTKQDTLDRKMLKNAYPLSGDCPAILMRIRIAFVRTIRSLYDLTEEEAKPIYALHELVLSQGLISGASEITSSLVNCALLPENRYVHLADAFLNYKRTDDAVGAFTVMIKKRGLDKTGYGGDLSKLYARLLQSQNSADARDLMTQINALDQRDVNGTFAKLADIFTKAGEANKSIEILQKLIRNDSTNVALSLKLGDALFVAERYDDIVASFVNNKTKEGMRYLARAYEKKYFLVEANKIWDELKKITSDPREIAEIKKHLDDNLITIMSPDYARLQAEANRPKIPVGGNLKVLIDSPSDGYQTASQSVEVTGRFLGTVTLKDVRINGISVGTPRGMKVTENAGQTVQQDSSKVGLPFTYVVNLSQGKNDITLEAFAPSGDSAEAKLSVTMNAATPKPMTIEEADGIRQNKAYGVIIGVAHYKSSEIKGLNYTVNDAKALYDLLTDPNYGGFKKENVTLLTDQDATTASIKKAIGENLRRAPEDGIAVVFFAGHGAPEGEQTFWLSYDTDPTSLYSSTLSNDDVVNMLDRINTKRVVTFIDACYSGASVTSSRSTRAFVEDPFKAFEGSGRMTITSSDGREQSLEDKELKHGIFTYRLLEALKGKADYNGDGIVMADEIARYVKENVTSDARERSHKQHPMVVANYSGYIPISRNAENVLKSSRIVQVQHFMGLYRNGTIDGATYTKIKDIIEGDDLTKKKPIKDYFDQVLRLKDLIELVGK